MRKHFDSADHTNLVREVNMAVASIAALRLTRNDVSGLVLLFETALYCVGNNDVFETLIRLGYRAISDHGLYFQIYQTYHRSYLQALSESLLKSAQILVEMLLLAESIFRKLGCPSYYQDFVRIVTEITNNAVRQNASLAQYAARLANIINYSEV